MAALVERASVRLQRAVAMQQRLQRAVEAAREEAGRQLAAAQCAAELLTVAPTVKIPPTSTPWDELETWDRAAAAGLGASRSETCADAAATVATVPV